VVVDQVDGSNQWLGQAEPKQIELSGPGGVVKLHPNEWNESQYLEDGTDSEAVRHLTQKIDGESNANK